MIKAIRARWAGINRWDKLQIGNAVVFVFSITLLVLDWDDHHIASLFYAFSAGTNLMAMLYNRGMKGSAARFDEMYRLNRQMCDLNRELIKAKVEALFVGPNDQDEPPLSKRLH